MDVMTPEKVESRLRMLGKELDEACVNLINAEHAYAKAKTDYELAFARQRMQIRQRALNTATKYTVNEIDDEALDKCAESYTALNAAEATVKAARENNRRINTQIDIARSVGTSVRAALSL